jgi:Xaa-Pro aminopeptidase
MQRRPNADGLSSRAVEGVSTLYLTRCPSTSTTEYDIQQLMDGWFREEGLVSDSPPNVSAEGNAGNPPYLPTATAHRRIGRNELVLLDLWGKLDRSGAVFADITGMGFTGRRVPERYERAFAAVCAAREAAVTGPLQAEILALG